MGEPAVDALTTCATLVRLDVEVLCHCYFEDALGDSCTDDQVEEFYQWCYQGTDPVVACFGSYYVDGALDCAAAIDSCL